MQVSDVAPNGLIFELSSLHDCGYCQSYVLLIFLTREFLAFVGIRMNVFFFLATILIIAMFNFQFSVRIKIFHIS